MNDHSKTKEHLIAELRQLRQQMAALQRERYPSAACGPDAAAESEISVDRHDQLVQQHDELLAQTIRAAKASICCVDVTTGTFIASPQALALHDLTLETPPTYAAAMTAIHPDDRPRVEAAWKRCVEQGESYLVEYRIVQQDGTVRWIASQGLLLPGLRGKKLWIMSQDITERKQMEEALHAREKELQLIVDAAPALISYIDADCRYRRVNQQYEQWFGRTTEEIEGRHVREVLGEAAWEEVRPYIERALTGETVTYERQLPYRGSEPRCAHVSFTPDQDAAGRVCGFVVHLVDITERKRAEEALRESEASAQGRLAELEALMEAMPTFIWMTRDPEAKMMSGNRAVYELVGVPPGSNVSKAALDQTDSFHFKALKDGVEAPVEELPIQLAAQGQEVHDYELEFRFADGRSRYMLGNATPLRENDGTLCGAISAFIDITERKQAEAHLRASEHKYRSLFESMSEGFALAEIIRDAQGNPCDYQVVEVNAAFAKLTGIPAAMAVGRTARELAPAAGADWMDALHTVALTGDPRRFQRHAAAVGKWFDVFAFCPEPGRIAALFVDITERRRAEEALRESEQLANRRLAELETIMEATPALIWITRDPECRIITGNRFAYETLGLPPGTNLSKTPSASEHPLRYSALHDNVEVASKELPSQLAARGEEVRDYELELRFDDGSSRHFFGNATPLRKEDGIPYGSIAAFIDITGRKRMEEALWQSEWKYRTLFEALAQGVVYHNAAGELTVANPAAERILGLALAEMQGRLVTDPRWNAIREDGTQFSPEEYPPMITLRTGANVEDVIMGVFNPKENDYRWVVVDSIPQIRPGEKTPSGVFTVFSDITELKRSQEAIRHANERLEQRIQERTAALRQSEQRLRQLSSQLIEAQENERKRVANEIHDSAGQVLAALKYRLETTMLKLEKAGQSEMAEPVKQLIPSVRRCIDDMRRLQMELRPSILDEMGLIAAIRWLCREFQLTHPSIAVAQNLAVGEGELPDALKIVLFRIVQEALNNAGKYSEAQRVQVMLQTDIRTIRLRIEDDGRGFDLDEARTIRAFGQGLGLSSMRERAQYSGGTLTIESALGTGTRIEAVWPKKALV